MTRSGQHPATAVLIISTSTNHTRALRKAVEMEGGTAHAVLELHEAIEQAQEHSFPLIFLEHGVSDIDAATGITILRAACEPERTRIVALLNDPLVSKRDLAADGFDDVLRTPLDLADITLLIQSAVRTAPVARDVEPEQPSLDTTVLRQLSLDLAWSTTLEQQAQHGLRAACRLLGTERGAIWVRDTGELMLKCVAQSGLSDEYSAIGASALSYLSQEDWVELSRRPVFRNGPGNESGAMGELFRNESLSNSLTAALFTPSTVIGALLLFDLPVDDTDIDDESLQLLDTVTAMAAMAVDQTRLRDDLGNSEATYRQLVEEMPIGVFVHDAQGNFLMSNAAIESICGFSEEDIALMNLFDLVLGGAGSRDGKLLAEVLADITRLDVEDEDVVDMFGPVTLHLAAADGRHIEAEFYFRPLILKGREDERWIQAMARDVTNEARAFRELEALRGVAEGLTGIDDEFRALQTVLSQIKGSISYLHASVWRLSPDHQELLCAAQQGIERSELLADPGDGLAGEVLESLVTRHVSDLATAANANPVHELVTEIAVVPIYANDRGMGVLQVQTGEDRRLTPADIHFLESVSAQISGRLERLDLIQQIQKLETLDDVTGLDNRRAFYDRLNAACEQAGGQPVSLLHVDVDGFKALNDTYGHLAGDDLLRQIGATVQSHLAPPYHLGRFAGDEFCVILPGIAREQVSAIAEKIRIGVATQLYKADDQLEHLTVSIGAVTLPDDVGQPEKLVSAACDASMMAKQAGQNQVYQSNSAFGELSMQHDQLVAALRESPQNTLSLLVRAMDERLPERAGHAARVARLAMTLGDHLGISGLDLEHLGVAGYVHDIGMFLVPDEYLRKPIELSHSEREKLAIVPSVAHRLLSQAQLPASVSLSVVHQYERWDGTGYPGQLAGTSIPLAARIIAVADTVDAMTSPRAHRDPLSMPEVLKNLRSESGARFDPDVVAAAEMVFDDGTPEIKDVKTTFLRESLIGLGV